ncbi:60S ribosomal protein L26A [Conglomerata obtusa]
MKFNPKVSSQRRKNRKAHHDPSQYNRRIRMSSTLSKPLREAYNFRSIPIVSGDEVVVRAGVFKGKSGRVVSVKRREYKVHVDGCVKVVNGQSVSVGLAASLLKITKLEEKNGRKEVLMRKKEKFDKIKEAIKERENQVEVDA